MRLLPVLLLTLFAAVATAQEAYRWIGKDGKVHYSDSPPPPDAQKAEQKQLNASVVGNGEKYSYETRKAAQDFPVTLYVAKECDSACLSARSYLAKRGIPYQEKAVLTTEDVAALKQAAGSETLPTLLVGRQASKGFEEGAWGGLLDTAGYPAGR